MAKPTPGLDVPVVNQTGQMNQSWYEYFQSLVALLKSTTATADAAAAAIFVSSIDSATGAITLSYPLSRSSQALLGALTSSTAALGADVALNNIANYFDGPSLTLGPGTWDVTSTVTVIDTGATAAIYCKLWDGTTVMASGAGYSSNLTRGVAVTLSGIIIVPVSATVKTSCRDPDAVTGKILFNQTGNSKDSHITAVRIA